METIEGDGTKVGPATEELTGVGMTVVETTVEVATDVLAPEAGTAVAELEVRSAELELKAPLEEVPPVALPELGAAAVCETVAQMTLPAEIAATRRGQCCASRGTSHWHKTIGLDDD